MPKKVQATEQNYTREEAEAYHCLMLEMVQEVGKWARVGQALTQEPASLPGAMESFKLRVERVQGFGSRWALPGNDLSDAEICELFERICDSILRYRVYHQIINARIRYRRSLPKLLDIVELEERFQHYQYKKARRAADLGLGPRFENWRTTNDCHTFYNIMRA